MPTTVTDPATATAERRMLNSDAFAWYMEKDPVLRSTIVAVCRLDSPPDWEILRTRIDALTRHVPSLRMKVAEPPLRLGPPRWCVDDTFDLDFHLRHLRLPEGATWDDVVEFARTAAMDDFDRARPLWEFTLLEGLEDGGAAFVTKLHHSLSDGIGGIQLAAYVVDLEPAPNVPARMPDVPEGHPLSAFALTAHTLRDEVHDTVQMAQHTVRQLPRTALHTLRHPRSSVRDALGTTRSIGRFVAPVNRQYSRELGQRRLTRRLATIDIPFDSLHDAAIASSGHLNDAFIAGLVEGMHRYHEKFDAKLDEVRVTVPLSLRRDDDPIGGNRITLARITVPASISDPRARMRRIRDIMHSWRHEPALAHTQGIAFGLNLVPRQYLSGIFKRIELLASDVPGIPVPVWLAGARVTGYYAFGPTIGAGVNATLMSYDGICHIGVNIDTSAITDPDILIECIRDAFDEILAVGPEPADDSNNRTS